MDPGLQQYLETAPVEGLVPVMDALGARLNAERVARKGVLPFPVWRARNRLRGSYAGYEVIVEVLDENGEVVGYALQKREDVSKDDPWYGMWQVCGTRGDTEQTTHSITAKLSKEIFGPNGGFRSPLNELLGHVIYDVPEQGTRCNTTMFRVRVHSTDELYGTWRVFSAEEIVRLADEYGRGLKIEVIDYHLAMLVWRLTAPHSKFVQLNDFLPLPRVFDDAQP